MRLEAKILQNKIYLNLLYRISILCTFENHSEVPTNLLVIASSLYIIRYSHTSNSTGLMPSQLPLFSSGCSLPQLQHLRYLLFPDFQTAGGSFN